MSFLDSLKRKFSRKPAEPEALDSQLSLAMPDASLQAQGLETVQGDAPSLGGALDGNSTQDAMAQADFASGDADYAARPREGADSVLDDGMIAVPVLGRRPAAVHQRLLLTVLVAALLALGFVGFVELKGFGVADAQLAAVNRALTQSQRLARAASQAAQGEAAAFADLSDSLAALTQSVRGLREGGDGQRALGADLLASLDAISEPLARTEKEAGTLVRLRDALIKLQAAAKTIQAQSGELLVRLEAVESAKLQQRTTAEELAALSQLKMLSQRMARSAADALSTPAASKEASAQLARDQARFQQLLQALTGGSAQSNIAAPKDPAMLGLLDAVARVWEGVRGQADVLQGGAAGLASAAQARSAVLADSEPMRRSLESLQGRLQGQNGLSTAGVSGMILAALVALLSAAGLSRLQLADARKRQDMADAQRRAAERMQQEAKRVNDATQAAILRLMNELQLVAEGDLTQEATVTEDITGAIADSINYTVEELRNLVTSVQRTADRVAQTTTEVDANSTELLVASREQLHEIQETGASVLAMAGRINEVSTQAQQTASVSRQALAAAESGLKAVQDSIGGMNSIRDQMQETSKRIKRLGESSQEIGEITELISDITEQTNVLALNAAIQAASAGEAGRGFSVVAEEVQRLAERSADATRQIAVLVKGIQTDTQDAIGAMERSTQGVVEGARLSDNAGSALSEIDRVTRRAADLIEQIAGIAEREASQANVVADSIQHIFAVTEQTSEGTQLTAGQVRELSRMAEELRQSVSRFKVQ